MRCREAQQTVDREISQYHEGYFSQAFDDMMHQVSARDAERWTRKAR